MIFAITVLSLALFLSIIFLGVLFNQNLKLTDKLNNALVQVEKEKENMGSLVKIEPGDTCIIPDYGLEYNEDVDGKKVKTSFKVTYEVEVIEVAKGKLKVKATDFTSTDSIARDPKRKSGIINFLKDKWVDSKSVEIVMDTKKRRSIKLAELGI
jgi:hypothetical protein